MRNKNFYLIATTVFFLALFVLSINHKKETEESDPSLNENIEIETPNEITDPDDITIETPRPKTSGAYNLDFIHIDGNWSAAEAELWCYKQNGVYIIENVTIDATNSPINSGILINNSNDVSFIVRNCTIYNVAGPESPRAGGIKLVNCSKGTLFNNTCRDGVVSGRSSGILVWDYCHNITVEDNYIDYHHYHGIQLCGETEGIAPYNVTVKNNKVYDSQYYGVYLVRADNNTIRDNFVSDSDRRNIRLVSNCDYNRIINNTVTDTGAPPGYSTHHGIVLSSECDNNIIRENKVTQIYDHGIYLINNCHNNTIKDNTVKDNGDDAIRLEDNCDDNKIINNTASDTAAAHGQDNGIWIENGCERNMIINNTCNDNGQEGIYIYDDCDDNIISYNIVKDNTYRGFYLYSGCDNNTIFNNTVINNGYNGILLITNCHDNNVSKNYACGNGHDGILLQVNCDYNTIFNNTCNNNIRNGIYIYDGSDYNNITYNTANGNGDSDQDSGIYLYNSDYNVIHNNTANGNYYSGIYLYSDCNDNNITNNVCSENDQYGIKLYTDCHNNTLDNNTANDNFQYGIQLHTNCTDNDIINNLALNTIEGYDQNVGIRIAWYCDYNTYANNTANGNTDSGISIAYYCTDSIIVNNTCKNNGNGIEFYSNCENHIIENNTVNENYQYGILLEINCNNNNITGNIGIGNDISGIRLYTNCDFNLILNNTFSYSVSEHGIDLETGCVFNTIINNTLMHNNLRGIRLYDDCDNNTISGNTAYYNGKGIELDNYCDNNTILGNSLKYNSHGIHVANYCEDNFIIGNNCSKNTGRGIAIGQRESHYTIIDNNYICNNGYRGIEIYFWCGSTIITNNIINNNIDNGLRIVSASSGTIVHNNTINGNTNIGIYISDNTDNCRISHNIVNDNNNYAVYIAGTSSENTILIGNTFNNNNLFYNLGTNTLDAMNCFDGVCTPLIIDADSSTADSFTWEEVLTYVPWFSGAGTLNDPYMIEGITINASGNAVGLYIIDSKDVYFKIKDCTVYEAGSGSGYDAGIKLENTCNGTIINNIVSNNENNGICLISGCRNNTITENTGIGNKDSGLRLQTDCDYNIISNNNFSYSDPTYGNDGIQIESDCDYNTIINNILNNNKRNGLRFWDTCNDNKILKNTINGNIESGIVITLDSDNNNFSENTISNNLIYGAGIHAPTCDNNLFYNNTFTGNTNSHIYDESSNTKYNNTQIGNYWDDYGGIDADDNGIGDTDYNVYGSLWDELPIWWDAPVVSITTPSYMDVFGNATINFTLSITRTIPSLCNMWYMLVNNTNPTDKTGNQTFTKYPSHYILYNLWNTFENGTIKIWFFLNDSRGYIGSASVIIQKNIYAPTISIVKIGFYGVGGVSTINFTVALDGPDVDTLWYRIYNGTWSKNYTFNAISGQMNKEINPNLWKSLGNGTLTIQFFLNDTLAPETTKKERKFIKDIVPPSLIITSPSNNDVAGISPPDITFNINESQLHQIWYELDDGTGYGNYTYRDVIADLFDKIKYDYWKLLNNGTVIIKFWANDTGGNVNYTIVSLSLRKDIYKPIIDDIDRFYEGWTYGSTPPLYTLEITEPHFYQMWYTLFDGTNLYTSSTYTSLSGSIDQTLWNNLNNGEINVTFYVEDQAGNVGYKDYAVIKEVAILPGSPPPADDDDDDDDGEDDTMDWIIRALLAGLISGTVGISLRIAYSKIKKKREAARQAAAPTVILKKKYQIVHHDFLTPYGKVEKKEFKVGIAQIGLSKTGNLITELFDMTPEGLMRIRENMVETVSANIKSMVKQAHENGINILLFPEMTFDLNYKRMVKDVKQWAQDYNMYIITGGYHDIKTKQNICAVFGPEGIQWEQEKHTPATIHFGKHVFTEAIEIHHPPHKLHICATEYGRIAIAICRDFLDMDLRVEIKNCEPPVDLFFNPAYTPVTVDFEATHFDARRAVYAYTFFANVAEYGGTIINTPEKDRTKRQIPPKEEGLIFKDVDLFSLRSERNKWERRQSKEKRYIQSTRS